MQRVERESRSSLFRSLVSFLALRQWKTDLTGRGGKNRRAPPTALPPHLVLPMAVLLSPDVVVCFMSILLPQTDHSLLQGSNSR
jgi:hypothetical protein